MDTNQMRTGKGYLFGTYYSRESAIITYMLAEAQRQEEEWQVLP